MYQIAIALIIVVGILVPVMLCVKPCCFRGAGADDDDEAGVIEFSDLNKNDDANQNLLGTGGNAIQRDSNEENSSKKLTDDMMLKRQQQMKSLEQQLKSMSAKSHGNSFGEAFIHQMIETIEFVLGTVSNTASYLRLWALSLAHGQLAETFLNLTFKMVFPVQGTGLTILLAVVLWPIFWSISFAVLMCMDLLECFLHTLRLHWVEF